MTNEKVAALFRDIADILEIKGENPFRVRAYERAATTIESLGADVAVYVGEHRAQDIPGVGKDLAAKIEEIVTTGSLAFYEELKKSIPAGLLEVLAIPSVGPKTAKVLYEQAGITGIAGLEEAIAQGRLAGIAGIKEKTIENIRKGIELVKKGRERMSLAQAFLLGKEVVGGLSAAGGVKKISCAGSLRRRKETVRDIDVLATSSSAQKVMDAFTGLAIVKEVIARGETKSSIRTAEGVQVDCRVVEERSYGAALVYFTGSKDFNIKLRQLAIKQGLKVNEYGVFRGDTVLAGRSEEDVFRVLGLPYIEPEMREDRGEIELALKGSLPTLVKESDIRADLHMHSSFSDGNSSIEEMAQACRRKGYGYCAVTDHSQGLAIAHGLSIARLAQKKKEIDRINGKQKRFRVLFAAEVDIASDGTLDYPDKVLREFDLVVAAIHGGFKQSKEQLTRRLVRACQNKYVHIIAHLTGRLWGERAGYELDLEAVLEAAKETNTALEVNSYPLRLDLNDSGCRRAKDYGVKIAVSTDAHTVDQLDNMKFGVAVARRGWLEKEDLLNTLPVEKFLQKIKK